MDNLFTITLIFLIAAVPVGVIICYILSLESPTTYGSGNIGATNVARQNKLAGVLTLLLDACKGYLPLLLLAPNLPWMMVVSVAGHCYSPFLRFKGGKGVATALGALAAYHPALILPCMLIWLLTYSISQSPGGASIAANIALMLYATLYQLPWLAVTSLIVLYRHKNNALELYQQYLCKP